MPVTSAAALLARTFIIGIAVAAPVGAMGVLCIERTLSRGWRAGMTTGAGIATADAFYAGMAAFGVSALSSALVSWQTPLRVLGGSALIALGVHAMRKRPRCVDSVQPEVGSAAASYVGAVGLTLTNPMTIMAFGAVFASAGLAAQPGLDSALLATAGVGAGSLAWWLALVTGVWLARRSAGDGPLSALDRVSGAVIVLFGVYAIVSVFTG